MVSRKKNPRQLAKKGLDVFKDWIQKQNPKDVIDVAILSGLAFLGYERFHDWKGALLGPISYRLATTQGGGALDPGKLTGVAGLLFLGAAISPNSNIPAEEGGGQGFWEKSQQLQCRKGYVLDWNAIEGWHCKPIGGPPT